ncbi:putative vacuolar protein sorting-associated protein 13A [Spatholobus suberectus]|nr:putative vacuolar protein sorting-associated protein 13A [Spatholobus suberectus]
MFEGLVHQLLLGYLGRYFKDIQKEQLKIRLEEVLLENVDLILDAFDYLQLPFALKQGRVGKLSIKIPWKKPWDPIIIILEDVFISASQRGDQEWSADAVEKREFAGKKAKLAAAELGKLSRRVCGSQAGQSFISHVTAKILDSIQVDIRNFHVLYCDTQNDLGHIMFGLKFTSLIMKQNLIGSSNGRVRVGQEHKIVEVKGLELYSRMFHGSMDLVTMNSMGNSSASNIRLDGNYYYSILAPCDVTLILSDNRLQNLDDSAPQYSVTAELSGLVISLDEVQLQHMFLVWDYICTCRLREKYGRFRPWNCLLPRKCEGWQIYWWHYAQESVLSDVRKKLKKTSWRYLGDRLSYRRKYMNLYKTKLDFLQQEQLVDDDILQDLEKMEKESDLDDILNYRSAAEYEMRELLSRCTTSNNGKIHTDISTEKSYNDEHTVKSRGWLNWLSRGMLGAGGTDDSSQFSGVVSYDVKDISEATEFHPLVSSSIDVAVKHELCIFSMKFEIHEISATLCSKRHGKGIAEIIIEGGIVESKIYKERGNVISKFKSVKMVDPSNRDVVHIGGPIVENNILDNLDNSCSIQVNFSSHGDMDMSVKGMLQQLEVTVDANILSNLLGFYDVFTSFKFHNERVLLSLNGIENDNIRLLSKAEYISVNHKKVVWDVTVVDVSVNFPWSNTASEYSNLVMKSRSLCFKSTNGLESFFSKVEEQPYSVKNFLNSVSTSVICLGIQLQDLYHYFDVTLNDFKITMINSDQSQKVSILEKFSVSFFLAFCMIPDESMLKQLEVYVLIESLKAHLTPSIYGAFIELMTHLGTLHVRGESEVLNSPHPPNIVSVVPTYSTFGISIVSKIDSVDLEVDLEDSGDSSSELMVSLQKIVLRYASTEFQEFFVSLKSLMICAYKMKEEKDSHVVLLSGNLSSPGAAVGEDCVPGPNIEFDQYSDEAMLADACFAMHYESPRTDVVCHKFFVYLSNTDIHCYPHIAGLLTGFFHRLSAYSSSFVKSAASNAVDISKIFSSFGLQKFGFSNYFEFGSTDSACIPLDCFPFVTIHNSGSLGNLESTLIHAMPDWRKYFILRDRKIKSSKINMRRGSKFFQVSPSKSKFDFRYFHESGIASTCDIFSTELHLFGIRAHFHDSSCIIGTIMVPTSRSSLLFCEDSVDILSSSEGLALTSSWGPRNFQDYLWGPSSPNLSPILNVWVRKGQNISSTADLEISIGIQHVYCMLPSEYLSIIIGYFSLSDWGGASGDQCSCEEQSDIDVKNEMKITYKFEILDSNLIFPVESNDHQFIKIEMPQLYCSFIENSGVEDVLKNIPPEFLVPIHKLDKRNNCLNVFGRDLFVSFLLYKNDLLGLAAIERNTEFLTSALIAPINADVWVRIPYGGESNYKSTSSICFMTNVSSCHIVAEDSHFFDGCMAIWDVIEELSSVDDQSKCFKSDVLQFLHSKRSLEATQTISPTLMASTIILTEVKCCAQSLFISFCHRKEDCVELIAKGDLQFICSASLINDSLVCLDLGFSTLLFYSPHDSLLAKCTSTSFSMSVLSISFSQSIDGKNELGICLSSLDIWLHLAEWTEVVKFLDHFRVHLESTPVNAITNSLSMNASNSVKKPTVKHISCFLDSESTSAPFTSQEIENDVLIIIRSENVCITFHVPVWAGEDPCVEFQHAEGLNMTPLSVSSGIVEEKDAKFLTVSLNMNGFELVIRSRDIQLKSNMEKLSSVIMIVENGRHTSWPLLDVIEVHVDAVLCKNHTNTIELNVEIICDNSNVWISHPAFHLWGSLKFDVPESGSSQYSTSGVTFKFRMRKVSILLTDGRGSYNGPELEILVRNILFHTISSGKHMECSVNGDLQVNYNNIEKVSWEPFIEPWQFLLTLVRVQEMSVLPNRSVSTDITLKSTTQLNINITESLVECLSRATEMFFNARGLMGLDDHKGNKLLHSPCAEYMCARKCGAPYVLQNLTSVPLLYHVYHGLANPDELCDYDENHAKYVQPGSSIPIYMDENAEQKLSRFRPSHSSDSLNEQRSNGFAHHYITVQLEGTSRSSDPISMDLVGLTCFEVNFSKSCNETAEDGRLSAAPTFVVPVVFDVSVLRYSKLIRIYSTVVLLNATSTPLELRFDIPFGVSPTILGPIQPGQQFPLPLHLAEAGCVRWRPMGNSYLWSEAHNLSNLLSVNSKVGNFKSFMCYPSHLSSLPFRCCLSVKNISLTSSGWLKNNVPADDGKKHCIYHLIFSAPLIINNYLPKEILLISESGGVDHTVRVSEVGTSVYHIDPSHDLGVEICIDGFKCSNFKFPRLETFCTMAKFSETKFSFSETLIFEPINSTGPVYVTVEKVMDAYSGSRELFFFVPFILYNCAGFPLCVTEATGETNERGFVIPSYCDIGENETLSYKKDGLSLLTSSHEIPAEVPRNPRSYMKNHTISCREDGSANIIGNYHKNLGKQQSKSDSIFRNSSSGRLKGMLSSRIQSTWKDSGSGNHEQEKVRPCIYSPSPDSSVNDVFVKISRCFPEDVKEQWPYSLWSNPFSLLPPSGSSTILVPQLTSNSAFILAVTSNSVAEQYAGRTNTITFQPRYVISNACSKEISYKQKGTDVMFYLGIGKHDHLHWTDTTRELLVSICYNESGWQWSGSFLPDHLGDTQLKMRNFVFGSSNMIRVEVQNADISMGDEKIVGNIKGNSGTNLILLSDDDTGYMPYRIDNFSKERLRIYQQRCEMFDTVIHSYTSYPYTWDEPCYPRRLIVEVPGERVLGSYDLDDVKEYMPVYLPSTSEKPERTFYLSVHAEGATKVLSVLDSNYHIFNDVKKSSVPHSTEKRLYDHNLVRASEYKEKISIFVPYIGISLIDSYPQELLFACIKDIQMNLLQSLDRQFLSLLISFLQIDNQLRSTPYPVMLSFNSGYRSGQVDHMKSRDDVTRTRLENLNQMSSSSVPVVCLEISKWRKKDISFMSFEYIKLRMEDFRLEIEQEVILSLFEFFTNVSSWLAYGIMPSSDHYDGVSLKNSSSFVQTTENFRLNADECPLRIAPMFNGKSKRIASFPSVVPIGAPWQEIYLLARTQKKIYIEMLELAPIKLTLSFSSAPWMLRNRILTSKEFLIHRGLMALADVEGAHIYLKDLVIAHHMASWESIQEILIRHYNRQLLHETYKLFGSAGVIGNPLGFARSMGLGIRDFLSVPTKSIVRSPTGLIMGMAQGTTSLLSNTVYAISDAASQFSKAARKGIVAFTYDDQAVSRMEKHQATVSSDSKGVINEILEGLTGLLQFPVRGAERHGLPGVLSGVALGITGLVAKPAASILEVTGKTALSIRNRSKPSQLRPQHFRVRLRRPLCHEFPLKPYSWEEAVGTSVLVEADDGLKFKDEKLVACKALKEGGKFVVLTERFVLVVFSANLINLGKPEFCGIPVDLEWIIEWEIGLENIIHADSSQGVVHIVGSRPDSLLRQNQYSPKGGSGGRTRAVRWNHYATHLPFPQTNLELACEEDAANLLQILLSAIEEEKGKAWDCGRILHRARIK